MPCMTDCERLSMKRGEAYGAGDCFVVYDLGFYSYSASAGQLYFANCRYLCAFIASISSCFFLIL